MAMHVLPGLSALKASKLQPIDAPSTLWERGTQWWKPWKIEFSQEIEGDAKFGLQHVVRITVTEGVVSKQRDMLKAMSDKFDPLFIQRFTPTSKSGKLNTVCSDHTRNFLFWEFRQSYSGMMPLNGIPPVSALPGGSPYMFFKLAFGDQPVQLAEALYTWQQAPGLLPSVTLDTWELVRQGDVEEQNLSVFQRLRRGAGFGEGYEEEAGLRPSRR
jgi:hypothetical protein